MKNKKAIIVVVCLIVIVLVIGMIIAGIKKKKTDDGTLKTPKEFTITYTIGGGFTTIYNAWNRSISIDQDGDVKIFLPNKQVDVKPVTYKVDKKKAKELIEYFVNNKFNELKEDLSEDDVMDASTAYLEVKSDTLNRKVGGYAAHTNKKFSKFVKQFDEIIDDDIYQEFNDAIKEAYEKE